MITPLSDALAERGYTSLTDVQQAVTAPELAEADLLVSAQTGSGKTVGFGLAIAPTLLGDADMMPPPAAPMALVVAPTRELALQVQRELAWLYAKTGATVVSCIGGMDARTERRALERGAHIVVGTPGRLRDHIERGALDLTDIRAIVLDEADEMLDLGFREDLEYMLGEAPENRRTLLFSATVPPSIVELAKRYQRDAERVTTLTKGQQHSDIEYQAIQVAAVDAEHAIINLLRFHDAQTVIVFANTRAAVARLTARFANRGFAVVSLSGELSQDERSHALQALRDGRARVCVATDVAARGIDLPNLELVIHADLPTNTEALLHRSGRTGRAGRKGISALIVPDKATKKAARLLGWAKIEANWGFAPTPEEIRAKDEARLLADPAWTDPMSEEETAFADTLLEQYSPQQIAAACLRLYQGKLSAPEELNTPILPREPREPREPRDPRAAFGPSAWVSLSVGRVNNAEARWLLPMLCRAGNLEKSQIGKIRVAESETFVELSESAVDGFEAFLQDGMLEDGISAKRVDGVPDLPPPPRRDKPGFDRGAGGRGGFERGGKPHRKGPRSDDDAAERPAKWDRPSKRRDDDDRPARDARPDRKPRDKAVWDSASPKRDRGERAGRDDGPRGKDKKSFGDRPFGDKPGKKPFGKSGGDAPRAPYKGRSDGDAPRGKPGKSFGGKPDGKPGGKPFGGKSDGKPGGKPFGGKPGGKSFGDKPGGKSFGGKPDGKPFGGKPDGKPAKPRGASDPSVSLGRPRIKGKGGDALPRRKR